MKILWCDLETTGVNFDTHDPVQIAGMVDIDGRIAAEFNITCQPLDKSTVSPQALQIQKRTMEDIMAYQLPWKAKAQLTAVLNRFCNKYDKGDKYIFAGQNCHFDKSMLFSWFRRQGDPYMGSYLHGGTLDLATVVACMVACGRMDFPHLEGKPSFKLEAVCKALGVELPGAHDALVDIRATRTCVYKLLSLINPALKEYGDGATQMGLFEHQGSDCAGQPAPEQSQGPGPG